MNEQQQELLDNQVAKWKGVSVAKADDSTATVTEVTLTPLPTGTGYYWRVVTLGLSDGSIMHGCTVTGCPAVFDRVRIGSRTHWESVHPDLIPAPKQKSKPEAPPEPELILGSVTDWTIKELLARVEEFENLIKTNNRLVITVLSLKKELTELRRTNSILQDQIDKLR